MTRPTTGAPISGPDAPGWWFARFMSVTLAPVLRGLYRTRVRGIENVPASGGYILAGNHVSYLDPILLWCVIPRRAHFMARSELFDIPVVNWVITRVFAFPVSRGSADRAAIQRATEMLTSGEPIGMFPEGTRKAVGPATDGGDASALGEAHSGVAFIAMRAGVPVVPVGISGTEKALPRGAKFPRLARVTVHFGTPVMPADFAQASRKERTASMTAEIMRRIAIERDAAEQE